MYTIYYLYIWGVSRRSQNMLQGEYTLKYILDVVNCTYYGQEDFSYPEPWWARNMESNHKYKLYWLVIVGGSWQ